MRIARFDEATLVPAYLVSVPLHSPLEVAMPRECDVALPLLEAIEQRADKAGIPIDARIEPGRTHRHAPRLLMAGERFARIVVAARTDGTTGFSAEDVAWLLREAPSEIVAIRAAGESCMPLPTRVLESGQRTTRQDRGAVLPHA